MMRTLLVAAALAVCAAVPAAAQEEPSPGEVAAIREMLEVSRTRENFIRGMELGMAQGGGMVQIDGRMREVLREFMDEHFSYEELEPDFIRAYAEQFTEDEIRAFTAFYRTPAGARFVERTPELGIAIQRITMERLTEALPQLMQRMMEAAEDDSQKAAGKS